MVFNISCLAEVMFVDEHTEFIVLRVVLFLSFDVSCLPLISDQESVSLIMCLLLKGSALPLIFRDLFIPVLYMRHELMEFLNKGIELFYRHAFMVHTL